MLRCRKRKDREGPIFDINIVGGTKDLSYGQLIDRIGVALGLAFPCGWALDLAAMDYAVRGEKKDIPDLCRIHTEDGRINLSGIETQVQRIIAEHTAGGKAAGELTGPLAAALMDRIRESLMKMIRQCWEATGIRPALLSGGVAASGYLRKALEEEKDLWFGRPELSSDNAVGTALLGMERFLGQ